MPTRRVRATSRYSQTYSEGMSSSTAVVNLRMVVCGGVAVAELVGVTDEVGVMLGTGLLLGVLLGVLLTNGAAVLLGETTGVSSPGRGVFVAVAARVTLAVNVGHGGSSEKIQDLVGVAYVGSVGGGSVRN